MPEYNIVAKVDRIVTSEVKMIVVADHEGDAMDKATKALSEYPEAVSIEGVNRIQTVKSNHWIPKSVEFTRVNEVKDIA